MKGYMNMYNPENYKYYTDGNNKIVAVSSYAGKSVRGVAKCDPRDTFDIEKGKALAAARCSVRVAEKRNRRATHEFYKAVQALNAAQDRVDRMREYMEDSIDQLGAELMNLDKISAEL